MLKSHHNLLRIGGDLLDLSTPIVMGILNITPDSFHDGGKIKSVEEAVDQAGNMLKEGAVILDIGGMSSRPGATLISNSEEIARVIPVIESLKKAFPQAVLSLDTWRSEVAELGIDAGAHIINDISGGKFDAKLWETVALKRVPYILMHIQGEPNSMQANPSYEDVTTEVLDELSSSVTKLKAMGVVDIIVDMGFGFGKTVNHNFQLLHDLNDFNLLGYPILVGLSRKSMIQKVLQVNAEDALSGTTALNMLALERGAKILRVHDVKEAHQCIQLYNKMLESGAK